MNYEQEYTDEMPPDQQRAIEYELRKKRLPKQASLSDVTLGWIGAAIYRLLFAHADANQQHHGVA